MLHGPLWNLQATGKPELLGQKDDPAIDSPGRQFKGRGDLFHRLAIQHSGDDVALARG